MAAKGRRGHALVKRLEQDENFFWRCECGAHYGAATGEERITREIARERHRIHLADIAGILAAGASQSGVAGEESSGGKV